MEGLDKNGNFSFNPSSMNVAFPSCDILDTLENAMKIEMSASGLEDAAEYYKKAADKGKTDRITAQVESELEILYKYPAHQMIKNTIDGATPQNPDVINPTVIKDTFNDIMDYYHNLGIEPEYELVSKNRADIDTYKFPDGTVVQYAEQYTAHYSYGDETCSYLSVTTPLEDGRIARSSLNTQTTKEKDIEGQQYNKLDIDFATAKIYDPKTACISDYDSNGELIKIYNPTDEQIAATYTAGEHTDMYWQGDGVDKVLGYSSLMQASKTADETENGTRTGTEARFFDRYLKNSDINYGGRYSDSSVIHVTNKFSKLKSSITPAGADTDAANGLIDKLIPSEQEKRANEIAGIAKQAIYHTNEISLGDYSEQIINQDDITDTMISSTSQEQNGNKVAFRLTW